MARSYSTDYSGGYDNGYSTDYAPARAKKRIACSLRQTGPAMPKYAL